MKRLLSILLAALPLFAAAQVSKNVTVATAGELSKQIGNDEKFKISDLKISGPLKQLEQVTPDTFTVKADLAGLGAGTWELIPVIPEEDLGRFPNLTVALEEQRIRVTLAALPVPKSDSETGTEDGETQTP